MRVLLRVHPHTNINAYKIHMPRLRQTAQFWQTSSSRAHTMIEKSESFCPEFRLRSTRSAISSAAPPNGEHALWLIYAELPTQCTTHTSILLQQFHKSQNILFILRSLFAVVFVCYIARVSCELKCFRFVFFYDVGLWNSN